MTAPVDGLTAGHGSETDSSHGAKGMDIALMGMLLFIASEIMFFAALFGVYFNVRATAAVWPPEGTEFISWQGSGLFGLGLSVLITIILVSSSFTMQWATDQIRKGDRTGMNRGLAVTLGLGIVFLCLMMFEYYMLVIDGRLRHQQRCLRLAVLCHDRASTAPTSWVASSASRSSSPAACVASSRRSTTWRWRRSTTTGTSWTWSGCSCS